MLHADMLKTEKIIKSTANLLLLLLLMFLLPVFSGAIFKELCPNLGENT